ncbi:MAG: hypothetical protein ACKVHE_27570 [Planctomycetales bacterium]
MTRFHGFPELVARFESRPKALAADFSWQGQDVVAELAAGIAQNYQTVQGFLV